MLNKTIIYYENKKKGLAVALNENLKEIIKNKVFVDNMKDILEYRTIEYYRRYNIGLYNIN